MSHSWKGHKEVSRKVNSDDEIDNVNQGSDNEIGGDSSEELDDDTVHQNVLYKFVDRIKSWWIYFSACSYYPQSTYAYGSIVWKSWTMILSIKMSSINLWTVSNPDEFIFPHAVIVLSQPIYTYWSKTLGTA
jgi:hypothetical protein